MESRNSRKSVCPHHNDDKIVDGSEIMKLVGNKEVFTSFVDDKFQELDRDNDGKLSVKELQPAVAEIGAALGLPPQGTSPDSDQIYSEVLDEFTHGKEEKVSKSEFKEVLSDILVGMAAGLKRDPIVILRIDGEDLIEFIHSPSFESLMLPIYSDIQANAQAEAEPSSSKHYIVKALEKLTVDQGMPPCSDSWVMSNIVEPAVLESCVEDKALEDADRFLKELKKVGDKVAQFLKEHPVIVAHTDNTFDGAAIRRLVTNKFELDKTINGALQNIPKDKHGKISKAHLRVALDTLAPAAGLPPLGAIDQARNYNLNLYSFRGTTDSKVVVVQTDMVMEEALKMVEADDGKTVKEEEFKKLVLEILGSVMLQLEGNPISFSYSSVVHEPFSSASSLLQPLSTPHPT